MKNKAEKRQKKRRKNCKEPRGSQNTDSRKTLMVNCTERGKKNCTEGKKKAVKKKSKNRNTLRQNPNLVGDIKK